MRPCSKHVAAAIARSSGLRSWRSGGRARAACAPAPLHLHLRRSRPFRLFFWPRPPAPASGAHPGGQRAGQQRAGRAGLGRGGEWVGVSGCRGRACGRTWMVRPARHMRSSSCKPACCHGPASVARTEWFGSARCAVPSQAGPTAPPESLPGASCAFPSLAPFPLPPQTTHTHARNLAPAGLADARRRWASPCCSRRRAAAAAWASSCAAAPTTC